MPSKYDCLQFSPCLLLLLSLYSALEHRLVPTAAESAAYYMHMHLWRAGHKPSAAVGKYMPEMCVCVCMLGGRTYVCVTHTYTCKLVYVYLWCLRRGGLPGAFWRHQLPSCCAPLIHKRRKLLCVLRAPANNKNNYIRVYCCVNIFFLKLQQTCESTKCKQYIHTFALLHCLHIGENARGENENKRNNK